MIDTTKWMEKFLQDQRFGIVRPYLIGDVLDFGGNKGELGRYVAGHYQCVNYDHSTIENRKVDTIVSLATIEHLEVTNVYEIFARFKEILSKGGHITITTPAPLSKPVLEFMAILGIVDRANIEEHKHYWTREDLEMLGKQTGFVMTKYQQFQFGFNQIVVFRKEVDV
jgi:2-polyprenyl-3-methyl-5-hydroxy-6-metoxy-1,4-benzoquinol methylase